MKSSLREVSSSMSASAEVWLGAPDAEVEEGVAENSGLGEELAEDASGWLPVETADIATVLLADDPGTAETSDVEGYKEMAF